MQTATLIMQRPDGVLVSVSLNPSEAREMEMPEHMAGPFKFSFTLDDEGGTQEFECALLLSEDKFVAAFEKFPVYAAIGTELYPDKILEKIVQHEDGTTKLRLLSMDVASLYNNGKWLVLSSMTTGEGGQAVFLVDDKLKCHSAPFYNFYEHTAICCGSINLQAKAFQRLQNILTSRATPHQTYSDKKLHFRPKGTQLIKDDGGKVRNQPIDLPEMAANIKRLLSQKPFATIQPL